MWSQNISVFYVSLNWYFQSLRQLYREYESHLWSSCPDWWQSCSIAAENYWRHKKKKKFSISAWYASPISSVIRHSMSYSSQIRWQPGFSPVREGKKEYTCICLVCKIWYPWMTLEIDMWHYKRCSVESENTRHWNHSMSSEMKRQTISQHLHQEHQASGRYHLA